MKKNFKNNRVSWTVPVAGMPDIRYPVLKSNVGPDTGTDI
jgi:hypothetical protein